ncbi:DNA-binding protein [Spirosoma sp.]|uniref:DNA-binding protein n=1 Tax=Spirosoma sp. TaxID=1899569 RepID=UPI003B3A7CA9
MEMVILPADQVRSMMIEAASIAVKSNPPKTTQSPPAAEPISPEELCKRLDISKPTAWSWEKKGLIKGYHLGNRKYFIWQEVIASLIRKEEVKA